MLCGLLVAAIVDGDRVVNAQEPMAQAKLEIQNGRTANAIAMLEDYRRLHPKVPEIYNLLGVAYAAQGNDDQAVPMFAEFARLEPNRPEAYNNLGASYFRRGDVAQAETAFRRALALRADDRDTLYNLGSLLNSRHDYAEARPLLVRALRHERSAAITFQLAVAQAGLGQRKDALGTLGLLSPPPGLDGLPWVRLLGALSLDEGRWEEAAKAFELVLSLAPNDQLALYSLGLVRLKSNRVAEAVSLFEQSFVSLPLAQRDFKIGALLAERGFDAEAIDRFERAVNEDPQIYDAYFNLAVVHLRRREVDSAAEAATRALLLRQTGEAYNLLGDIREEQGQYREALENLQHAVQLEPENEEFVFDVGLELILHENYDAASELLGAAQARFPQSARIVVGLGATDLLAGKEEDAVKAFLKAVNLDPHYEPAYTFLGMAALSMENVPSAVVGRLESNARVHVRSFEAQYYYGAALVRQMEYGGKLDQADAASEALHRSATLRPDYAQIYYYLGEIKRLQGHVPEAAQLYEKAVELDPTSSTPLYKLSRAYLKMGRHEDADRILARYSETAAREQEAHNKHMEEIKTFVLTVRTER